jgi:predicted metal-dependent peptidase
MCGIARQFHSVDMVIIVCDCEIHDEPLDLKNTSPEEIMKFLELKGRGGTSHKPVFNWIKENRPQAVLLIAFTDGQTSFPKENDVSIKTLWVLSGSHINEDEVPFGVAITIPKYE